MKSNKIIARTFGVFFLLAFVSYGLGSGITGSITGAEDALQLIQNKKGLLVIGVILMALVHSVVNIGLPVLMQPLLKPVNKILSYGYLSAGIAATLTLIFGSLFLLLFIPLGSAYANAGAEELQHFETIKVLLIQANFYAYQIGMTLWGVGGLLFCTLLYKSQLVPRVLSVWGGIGYLVFIAGTIAELFGSPIGVQLAIPGGLFEITLSFWLIFKGFREKELEQD